MAELGFGNVGGGGGGGGGTSNVSIIQRVLIRTGDTFPSNTSLNINTPGTGWVTSGNPVTFSGSSDLVDNTQFYRNGQLLLTGEDAAANNDVYFSSLPETISFEFPIITNDVLQVWKFDNNSIGGSPIAGMTPA